MRSEKWKDPDVNLTSRFLFNVVMFSLHASTLFRVTWQRMEITISQNQWKGLVKQRCLQPSAKSTFSSHPEAVIHPYDSLFSPLKRKSDQMSSWNNSYGLKGSRGACLRLCNTRNAALAFSVLSMPSVLNFPCCRLLCIKLTALLTPRWMSWRVVAGKPCRSLLNSTSLAGEETGSVHANNESWKRIYGRWSDYAEREGWREHLKSDSRAMLAWLIMAHRQSMLELDKALLMHFFTI